VLRPGIQLRPDNIDAWRRKGFTLRILNRTEDAIKCYDKIVELNPKDTAALNDKANALDDLSGTRRPSRSTRWS